MADRSFEVRLERLFGETPAFADADYFAARLVERLDRGWNLRQVFIVGMGLVGGVIAAGQILRAGLVDKLVALADQSQIQASTRLANLAATRFLPADFPINGQLFWMSAVLAAMAVGFAINRVIREI